MKKYIPYKTLLIFCLASFFYACSPTRYVGKDEYLLHRVKVRNEEKNVSTPDLKKAIRQRPNTRILGIMRFHLGLYNLSGSDESKSFNRWLRSIGEAPVIYSPFLMDRSITQLQLYLNNKGYFHAAVTDSVWFKKKKAYVEYRVETGPVTRIRNFAYQTDSAMRVDGGSVLQLVRRDSCRTLVQQDTPLDVEVLEAERERVNNLLRSNGYYNFSKSLIHYYADTLNTGSARQADLTMTLLDSWPDSMAYRKFKINSISVNLDYDPLLVMMGGDSVYQRCRYDDYEVIYYETMKIKAKVILETIQFVKGEQYNVDKVISSYSRLQALNLFKFINIVFRENTDDPKNPLLDCEIQLTPMKRQSYNVFLEGTNNSGNIGVGGNFSYNHKNLFHGGENLTLRVWGALKKEKLRENEIFSTTEVGTELKFVTPQFWLPVFRLDEFRRNFAPKTSISFSYSQEHTQFYHRRIASVRYGYLWRRADNKWRYNLDLIDLNYVMMPFVDENFINGLKNQYIRSAYTNHMILSANFSTVFTDQEKQLTGNFNYFKGNLETSGNLLLGVDRLFGKRRSDVDGERFYTAFGVRYAQFAKADGEYRFNHYINRINSMVYRFFIGCGYPYGNMKALPFEEAYFCGGANDIRAWQSRMLGPGSYMQTPEESKYPNSVGDFKLTANVEYRFKLFWLLEGALFFDVGNVWNINRYANRSGAQLQREFYRQIAVGTGAGLRLNVTFFLLRFDLGIKLHDPAQAEGQRFVLLNRNGGFKKAVFNIAIGYPF